MEEKPIGKNSQSSMTSIPFDECLYVCFHIFFLNAGASTSKRMSFKGVCIDR